MAKSKLKVVYMKLPVALIRRVEAWVSKQQDEYGPIGKQRGWAKLLDRGLGVVDVE